MIRRHITALRLALMAADGTSAVTLFGLISLLRFGSGWPDAWRSAGVDPYVASVAYAGGWVAILWLLGLYRLRSRWTALGELPDVLRAGLLVAILSFSALFIAKVPDVSRLFLLALFASQVLVTTAARIAIRLLLARLRERGHHIRYMLVVGTGSAAHDFVERIERHRELGLKVIGHLADDPAAPAPRGRPVLGPFASIETVLHQQVIDEVAICLPADQVGLVEPITRLCEEEGKVVRIPLGTYSISLPGGRTEEFDGIQVLSLVYGPDRAVGLVIKRLLDITLSGLALVILSPLLLAVALAVALFDERPILFRQTRLGLHGRPFQMLKFRTMVPNAEELLAELAGQNEVRGPAFKLARDPRISRGGRLLRAFSLDELPQLWNVLRGEMSLVGPRPPLPAEVANYDVWHRRRLSMKPGITGLWQVEARRDQDFDRWVKLDLAYIDRWSIWLDFVIMLKTLPAMAQGR